LSRRQETISEKEKKCFHGVVGKVKKRRGDKLGD